MNENKEFFYTDFNSLGSVLNRVISETGLKQSVKKATLFKFWSKVVGKKFEKYSKIESLNSQSVLLVACANASVCSELMMFKRDIMKKMNEYAKPLGIEIFDINFSHKIWKKESPALTNETDEIKNPYKPDLSGFDPENVILDDKDVEAVKKSVFDNKFATQAQRQKMFDAIILDLKTQKYIKDNNLSHRQP